MNEQKMTKAEYYRSEVESIKRQLEGGFYQDPEAMAEYAAELERLAAAAEVAQELEDDDCTDPVYLNTKEDYDWMDEEDEEQE
jgi:hypothetical protein